LVVFGTSVQAEAHVACLAEVRPLASVTVVGRDRDRTRSLANRLAKWSATPLTADDDAPALARVLGRADIVATCTSASDPVFDGRLLAPEAVVVAIGSHSPTARELDAATLRNAYITVEDRAAAWREYGDLIIAKVEGAIVENDVACDIRELVRAGRGQTRGQTPGRRAVFKSAGMGWEDLAVAAAAYDAILAARP
jgi:ornithine cyclodeaminase